MYSQENEIKKIWLIKALGPSSVSELRAISSSKKPISQLFKGKSFPSTDALKLAFEKEALRLNATGYNVYYVMNPIHDGFSSGSATDKDIAYRDLLLIYIDKVWHKGESLTAEELQAALLLSEQIEEYLQPLGWDEPIRMMSGNGYHLYYVLDELSNDEKTKRLLNSCCVN